MTYFLAALLEAICITYICAIRWVVRNLRKRPKLVAALVAAYIGSYSILSVHGRYVLANHGGADWSFTWCPDLVITETEFIRPHINPTPLAVVYLPLLLIDRYVIHPPREPWDGYFDSTF